MAWRKEGMQTRARDRTARWRGVMGNLRHTMRGREGDQGLQRKPGDGGIPELCREPTDSDIYYAVTSGSPFMCPS